MIVAGVRTLLAARANPNLCSKGNKTPLMGACMNGHADVARALLDAGADVAITNDFGERAHDLASAGGHAECVIRVWGSVR